MKRMISCLWICAMVVLVGFSTGCYKQQYDACKAELENCQALFDGANQSQQQCDSERQRLEQELQRALRDLQTERAKPERQPGGLEKMGGTYDEAKGTITVTLDTNILFDSGSVTLKTKSQLGQIASIINREHNGKEVWVIGHTDTDPIKKSKWADNWQLSTERALAVVRQLVENGVQAKHLVAAGRGQYHPVGTSKERNRRVEIVVYTR